MNKANFNSINYIYKLSKKATTYHAANLRRKLVCYDFSGNVLWVSNQTYGNNTSMQFEGTPSFADFNQDGIAEVYAHNQIFNAQTGVMLADGGANGIGRMTVVSPYYEICLTSAADLDSNPNDLELAAGYTIYNVQISNVSGTVGNSMTGYNIIVDGLLRDGMTTFGDINLDGKLDVVVASEGTETTSRLYSYYLNNLNIPVLIAKTPMPRGTNAPYSTFCGAPFVGDLDGLGVPSICVTRNYRLLAYSYNGTTTFQQKWIINTIDQSGATGITSFDFDQNGIQELVFRDEQDMRIINGNGAIPTILSIIPCSSPTVNDMAIVADIDNTGTSKICVTCGNNNTANLKVYSSNASVPWVPSRKIWNQYGYHVYNINDDATIPQYQLNNATANGSERNNYFVQASLLDSNGNTLVPAADAFGAINCITNDQINDLVNIDFEISNESTASQSLSTGCTVSFFNGNPETNGIFLGSTLVNNQLTPGATVYGNYQISPATPLINSTIYMVTNNNGSVSGIPFQPQNFIQLECNYLNNIDSFSIISINAGIDLSYCGTQMINLNATQSIGYLGNWEITSGSGSFSSLTDDNSTFTPNGIGTNTLNWIVEDSSCLFGIDDVIVTFNVLPTVQPAPDFSICIGDIIQIGLTNSLANTYSWTNDNSGFSSALALPFVLPQQTTNYYQEITNIQTNCVNYDTVVITTLLQPIFTPISDFVVCSGDSVYLEYLPNNSNIYTWYPMNVSGPVFFDVVDSAVLILVNIENPSTGCIVIDSINGITTANIDNDLFPFEVCLGDSFLIQLQNYSNVDYFISTDSVTFTAFDSTTFYIPTNSGFYLVQSVTTSSNCLNTDTLYFTVNPIPIVNAGPDQVICQGDLFTLNGSGTLFYSWDNSVINGIPFIPLVTNTYVLTGTDINGCVNTDDVLITILPQPIVDGGLDQSICAGNSVVLLASSLLPFTWDNNVIDGVSFIPLATDSYTVTVTDSNGCTASDEVVVTVNAIPVVSANLDQTICLGSPLTLFGSGALTYTWDNNVINAVSFTPTSIGVTTYTVSGTSSAGCINTDEVLVSVIPLPILDAGLDTIICLGQYITINAISSPENILIWNDNYSNPLTLQPNIDVNEYVVQASSPEGCVTYDTVLIEVIPNPIAQFLFSPQEIIVSNTEIIFINTSTNAFDYLWIFNESDTSLIFSPSYVVQSNDLSDLNVTLYVTNEIGCKDSISIIIPYNESPLIFIPNCFSPDGNEFNNTFLVVSSGSISENGFKLLISNRWGEILFESNDVLIGWDGTYKGEIVQDGTYTWKVKYRELNSDNVVEAIGHVNVIK